MSELEAAEKRVEVAREVRCAASYAASRLVEYEQECCREYRQACDELQKLIPNYEI